MVRVCGAVKDRRGSVLGENKVMGRFGAGARVRVEAVVGSRWDGVELGMVHTTVLFSPPPM